jgi:hypothetical protein
VTFLYGRWGTIAVDGVRWGASGSTILARSHNPQRRNLKSAKLQGGEKAHGPCNNNPGGRVVAKDPPVAAVCNVAKGGDFYHVQDRKLVDRADPRGRVLAGNHNSDLRKGEGQDETSWGDEFLLARCSHTWAAHCTGRALP